MCGVLSLFLPSFIMIITFGIIYSAARTTLADHGGNQKDTGGVHVRSGGSRRMLGRPGEFVERAGQTAKRKQVNIYSAVSRHYY